MALIHVEFTTPMKGNAPVYGGQPRGETISAASGTTTAALGNNQVARVKAVSGDSYVKLGGGAVTGASDGFYLGEGDTIDLCGSPGDAVSKIDA